MILRLLLKYRLKTVAGRQVDEQTHLLVGSHGMRVAGVWLTLPYPQAATRLPSGRLALVLQMARGT
jgi:hypothetical protein